MKPRSKNKIGGRSWLITPEIVADIILRVNAGETKASLAREYGVAQQTIGYHYHSSKLIKVRTPYSRAIARVVEARKSGNNEEAARQLRIAADALAPLQHKEAA